MKKWIWILCVVATVGVASTASAAKMSLGLIGGVNWAGLTDLDETSVRTGFSGGGFVGADFSEKFGTRVEVLYTQKGARQNGNPDFGEPDTDIKLDYVELPVLFIATLTKSTSGAFAVFAGPSFGYNIGAESSEDPGETTDLSDDVEPLDVDLVLGTDLEHIRSSLSIFLDLRFSLGLTPVLENAASEYADVKNSDFLLMVGFKFPLGGSNK